MRRTYEDEARCKEQRYACDMDRYIGRFAVVCAIEDEVLLEVEDSHCVWYARAMRSM